MVLVPSRRKSCEPQPSARLDSIYISTLGYAHELIVLCPSPHRRFRAGGLPQQSLNKILKKLEARQLIKPVKSVNAGNVKKYMLYGLTPSKEVTGGPWYCDGEFDYEFISNLQLAALNFVQQKQQATAAEVRVVHTQNPTVR